MRNTDSEGVDSTTKRPIPHSKNSALRTPHLKRHLALSGLLPDASKEILTAGLPSGLYVLSVWAKGGNIVRKFIKL